MSDVTEQARDLLHELGCSEDDRGDCAGRCWTDAQALDDAGLLRTEPQQDIAVEVAYSGRTDDQR